MNNFDLWKILNFIVGKDVYANRVSGPEMNLELKAKNLRLFRKKLGFPESYRPGQTPPAIDTTRLLQADLKPFYVEAELTVPSTGIVTLPDWFYIEDFYSSTSRTAEIISRQEVSNRVRDAQTKPTTKDLVGHYVSTGLKVYPATIRQVTVLYIRQPKEPTFVVSTDPITLKPVYETSVELEWDDMSRLDILHMILADMGVHIERADVLGYAEQLIKTGD